MMVANKLNAELASLGLNGEECRADLLGLLRKHTLTAKNISPKMRHAILTALDDLAKADLEYFAQVIAELQHPEPLGAYDVGSTIIMPDGSEKKVTSEQVNKAAKFLRGALRDVKTEASKGVMQVAIGSLPLFVITNEVAEAFSIDDVNATLELLHAQGLRHLPFEKFWIEYSPQQVVPAHMKKNYHDDETFLMGPVGTLSHPLLGQSKFKNGDTGLWHMSLEELAKADAYLDDNNTNIPTTDEGWDNVLLCSSLRYAVRLLVVALATRNIVKEESVNTRLHNGKPPRPQYKGPGGTIFISRTIIRCPRPAGDGTHASPKMHLRRAHIHNYRHGKGRTLLKQKWLEPVLVNASDDVVLESKTYKIS